MVNGVRPVLMGLLVWLAPWVLVVCLVSVVVTARLVLRVFVVLMVLPAPLVLQAALDLLVLLVSRVSLVQRVMLVTLVLRVVRVCRALEETLDLQDLPESLDDRAFLVKTDTLDRRAVVVSLEQWAPLDSQVLVVHLVCVAALEPWA